MPLMSKCGPTAQNAAPLGPGCSRKERRTSAENDLEILPIEEPKINYRLNLAEYARYSIFAIFVAFLGIFACMPFWLYPADLTLPDGKLDPRVGRLNVMKAVSELTGVPALAVTGVLVQFSIQGRALDSPLLLYCILFVAILLPILGIAFIYSPFEKLTAPMGEIVGSFLKRLIGSGK